MLLNFKRDLAILRNRFNLVGLVLPHIVYFLKRFYVT